MDDILDYLEEISQPEDLGPEYLALTKKLRPFNDAFQAATSREFVDQWFDAEAEVMTFERRECFSRGFRLGARLILALAGPSAPNIRRRS